MCSEGIAESEARDAGDDEMKGCCCSGIGWMGQSREEWFKT